MLFFSILRVNWFRIAMYSLIFGGLLGGCTTKNIKNKKLWYQLTVPKTWTQNTQGVLSSGQGDFLRISRWFDDSPLSRFVSSQRKAIEIERVGFVTEDESWITLAKCKSWKMVGTHKQPKKNREDTWVYVIINTGQYKYMLEFLTPSENYKQRQLIFNKIIQSFAYHIPEY